MQLELEEGRAMSTVGEITGMPGSVADRFSLDGRVAIVSGSGTGIGRAIALVFAEQGADIVLAARRLEPLERTAADVGSMGRRTLVVPTDVTDPEQCDQLVAATVAEFGQVDVLVNNAGGAPTKAPMDWEADESAADRRLEPGRRLLLVARRRQADAPARHGCDRKHLVGI